VIGADLTRRQTELLTRFSLPTAPKRDWSIPDIIAVMRRDKKAAAGQLRFILPTRLGEVRLFGDIPEEQVREILAS
jgi:3-dehydroquinate synthase